MPIGHHSTAVERLHMRIEYLESELQKHKDDVLSLHAEIAYLRHGSSLPTPSRADESFDRYALRDSVLAAFARRDKCLTVAFRLWRCIFAKVPNRLAAALNIWRRRARQRHTLSTPLIHVQAVLGDHDLAPLVLQRCCGRGWLNLARTCHHLHRSARQLRRRCSDFGRLWKGPFGVAVGSACTCIGRLVQGEDIAVLTNRDGLPFFEQLLALKEACGSAQEAKVLLAVPFASTDAERADFRRHAVSVGFNVFQVIDRFRAALSAYGFDTSHGWTHGERDFLVVDIEDHIYDIAAVAIEEGILEVCAYKRYTIYDSQAELDTCAVSVLDAADFDETILHAVIVVGTGSGVAAARRFLGERFPLREVDGVPPAQLDDAISPNEAVVRGAVVAAQRRHRARDRQDPAEYSAAIVLHGVDPVH